LIEVKSKDVAISSSLSYFKDRIQPRSTIQLVGELVLEMDKDGISVRRAATYLSELEPIR
jgi:hypothetical protein